MSNLSESQAVVVAPARVALLDTKQAAQVLGVSWRTIQNLIASGQLPSITVGRLRRISVDAIEDFAKNGAVRIAKTITQPSVDDLAGFIEELSAGTTTLDPKFASKLSRVLTAHKSYLSGEQVDAEQIRKQRDAAFALAEKHVANHKGKTADGRTFTDFEKRVTRSLSAAIASFDLALEGTAA